MPNRIAQYFDDDPHPQVMQYRSPDVRMDQGDHLVGKLVVIGIFLVPAMIFAAIVIYAWTLK